MAAKASRYISRPRQWWDEEAQEEILMPSSCVVHEEDEEFTGLLDEHGNPLFRQKGPIGFAKG